MSEFWNDYPEISTDLNIIKELIIEVNKSSERYLNSSIDYLVTTGGKMLRPAFVLIGSTFGNSKDKEKLHNIAAAIETLHLATLIHDDIVDDSEMRRGKETIQTKYSKEYAVYMGDYLFTKCFMMLSSHEYTNDNLFNISKGISKICIGEMMQNQLRYNLNVGTKDYLKVISGKTAGLFAVSLATGANASDANDEISKKLARIGYNIGMAFQIIDDILDYSDDSKIVGKDTQKDIVNGYYTLPVIFALKSNSKSELQDIIKEKNISKTQILEAIEIIQKSGSVEKTVKLAKKYTIRALKHINDLPDTDGKRVLLELVPKLLSRAY